VVEAAAAELHESFAVVFTVAEEGLGALAGARHACATLAPASVIALEGHGIDGICVDAVGSLRVALAISGPGGHSWWDRGRPSATHALVALLAEMVTHAPDGVSLNIGRIGGGEAVNAIARQAEALVEARSLDEQSLEAAHGLLSRLTAGEGLELTVELLDRRPAGRLDRRAPLLQAVREERAQLGLSDRLVDGSTDANAALAAGIPALTLGCGRGVDMHAPSERIERSSIAGGVAQLDRVLRRLLG